MFHLERKLLVMAIMLSSFYAMSQKTIIINDVQIFNGKDENNTLKVGSVASVRIQNKTLSNLKVSLPIYRMI